MQMIISVRPGSSCDGADYHSAFTVRIQKPALWTADTSRVIETDHRLSRKPSCRRPKQQQCQTILRNRKARRHWSGISDDKASMTQGKSIVHQGYLEMEEKICGT
jgi:hypothetical protein